MILLIIPGWKQTSKDWKLLNDKLAYKLQSSVIDIPGFGIEPLIDKDWDITDYSNWIRKRIETEYKNEEICLIGHSFGGKIACEIASNQPEWLKLLIIISSPLLYRPNLKTKVLKCLAKITPSVIKNKFKMFSSEDYRNVKGTSLEKIFKKSINYDQTEQLKKIAVKTVIIWGEKDKFVPLENGKKVNSIIPNSKIEILPNCGHNIHISNPNLLYSTILKYVKKD